MFLNSLHGTVQGQLDSAQRSKVSQAASVFTASLLRDETFPAQNSPGQVRVGVLWSLIPCSHLPLPLTQQCLSCQTSSRLPIPDLPSS